MMSMSESLALERELLEKYKNFPIKDNFKQKNTSRGGDRIFNINSQNEIEPRLNNQSLHKKVLRFYHNHHNSHLTRENAYENSESDDDKIKWWWEPPINSTPKEFFNDTSMHGLKYLSQPKRHLCERIFWITMFLTGLGGATYLIYSLIYRYVNNPVIVQFSHSETEIHEIPFPAVTICNMNKLRKSTKEDIEKNSPKEFELAKRICGAQESFSNDFGYGYFRGRIPENSAEEQDIETTTDNMVNGINNQTANEIKKVNAEEIGIKNFIRDRTLRCDELIPLCRWRSIKEANCTVLFKDVVTEYGKCCTFNMLPTRLMEKGWENNPDATDEEIQEMSQWEIWSKKPIFVLKGEDFHSNEEATRPRVQQRAGQPYGLSFAVTVNTSDYFCPSSDSEGFRIMLHNPLELPDIRAFGMSIGMGNEIFTKVSPQVIYEENETHIFSEAQRECLLSVLDDKPTEEWGRLKYYAHNTRGNCLTECLTDKILETCNCSLYYMPYNARKNSGKARCPSNNTTYECLNDTRKSLAANFTHECKCHASCTDISFLTETTFSRLQPVEKLWADIDPDYHDGLPKWVNNNVSIVHVFYGDLSTIPKVRKALYSHTDLIANIGGLLGLCLGFSILSAVEVLYFCTCRLFVKKLRKRRFGSGIQVGDLEQRSDQHTISSFKHRNWPLRPIYKDGP